MDAASTMGPLTRKAQLDVLDAQVRDAVEKGARVLCGGQRRVGQGYFYLPTVVVNVNHSMRIMQEESFGPVIGVQKVPAGPDADRIAANCMNDTEYGLTAAVYTRDQKRAEAILTKVDAGTVYWNCCDRVTPTLPWTGRKHSGLGSTLSMVGIRAFVQPKAWHLRNG